MLALADDARVASGSSYRLMRTGRLGHAGCAAVCDTDCVH